MAVEGMRFYRIWNVALPSAMIAMVAVLANLLADALQERIDPRRTEAAAEA
jgi:ABC-type dipeptide/oligopeptide/nickel transport system permease subunit